MNALLLAAALAGAAAVGYVLGRIRPAQRVSDWAAWEKYGHPTGIRRVIVHTILALDVVSQAVALITWAIVHPRKFRTLWRHRNDPPPARSAPVRIPRVHRDDATQEGHQKP